jgi:Transglutaminase-like superfamily
MGLLHKFLTLERVEQRLLLEAAFLLVLIRLGLGRLPFTRLRGLVVRTSPQRAAEPDHSQRFVDQVVWAVTRLSQLAPRRITCLVQALAVQGMLSRRGYRSRLQIGVMRGQHGGLDGHAWVEHEGRVLIGGSAPELARFAPITAFDSDALKPLAAQGKQ